MQYTYDEAVRELSDFLEKNTTADNYWKMEQVLLTVLNGTKAAEEEYEAAYKDGYEEGVSKGKQEHEDDYSEGYDEGYKDGLTDGKSSIDDAWQEGYDKGYEVGVEVERDSWSCK